MIRVVSAVLALLTVSACMNDRVYMDPKRNTPEYQANSSDGRFRDATLRGDFGDRTDFDGPAEVTGYSDPDTMSTSATVTRDEGDRGAGMIILMSNGVLLDQLDAGTHKFSGQDFDAPVFASVCSGANANAIYYDATADEVVLDVEEKPEGKHLQVTTTTQQRDIFGSATGDQEVAHGAFLIGR